MFGIGSECGGNLSGESVWERGGLKDFGCGVVMLDEMMDEVMNDDDG